MHEHTHRYESHRFEFVGGTGSFSFISDALASDVDSGLFLSLHIIYLKDFCAGCELYGKLI